MSSAAKTLQLLSYFSKQRPALGLTQICQLANRDKATTYRHLQALEALAFVERDSASRLYRLGPAILQLAQVREETVPRKSSALKSLISLADASGETSHVSVLSGQQLHSIASHQSSKHSTRVVVDMQTLPLHATASGICALAFGPPELFERAASDLPPFTSRTIVDAKILKSKVDTTRCTGFGCSLGGYELDTSGLASPIFDQHGFAGTVSIACVSSRYTAELEQLFKTQLIDASVEISRSWGGGIPCHLYQLWADAQLIPQPWDTAS